MAELNEELSAAFRAGMLKKQEEVLFEKAEVDGLASGSTRNGLTVRAPGGIPGTMAIVRLDRLSDDGFLGSILRDIQAGQV